MFNRANLTFLATPRQLPHPVLAQSMVVFAIAIAAGGTIVGLGAIVEMYKAKDWVTHGQFSLLKW